MKIPLNPNEMVLRAGDSSYMNGGSPVRGKLILTTQRIYFKPENGFSPDKGLEIEPHDIQDVMFFNEKLLFPSGLNIVTKDGMHNRFLVKKRNAWSEMIVKMF